jgi:O-antigen ligase
MDIHNESKIKSALRAFTRPVWILFLLFLPVTSFPFFPNTLGGGALVRPLSLYPLIILLVLFTLPVLLTKPLPKTFLSLLPFVLIALISSLMAILQGINPILGVTSSERILRVLITLGIGGAIYTTVSLYPQSPKDLRNALRWIFVGFSVALLWGSLQAIYIIRFTSEYYNLLQKAQDYIAIRRLFTTRVSGMTYEPNWFAEQLTFLLLPWLLAAVLTGYSAFRWRWRWLTIESLLLVWSLIVLVFTFSRAGLVNLIILLFLGIIFFRPRPQKGETGRRIGIGTRRFIDAAVVILVLVALIYSVGTRNEFFARIWSYWTDKSRTSLAGYFEYLGFGARFIYSQAAYGVYSDQPWLGVGLGNYAFFFEENLPERSLAAMPEVLRVITPDAGRDRLITPKNFYTRLLAETGLLGTAAFMAFVIAILSGALFLWLSREREKNFWGIGGVLGVVAFLLSALTFDSFAIPNMWVVFGLTTAASWFYIRSRNSAKESDQDISLAE